MLDFFLRPKAGTQSRIRLVPVNLCHGSFEIPVAVIQGNRPGKTLLVTGGMDGDEYAGMEAAYEIVEKFGDGDFAGKLLVVPIVNVPGFRAECSQSPLDQKFPKYLFPGRVDGTPTERLVHWLVSGYANHSDAWMDLHGGAITEGVHPFLWLFESGVDSTDARALSFLRMSGAKTVVLEKAQPFSKAGVLARRGCVYVLAESGARGNRDRADVDRHVGWTVALMADMGMVDRPNEKPRETQPMTLRRTALVRAPSEGIWRPADRQDEQIYKGMSLGTYAKLDGTESREVVAPADGVRLWWKQTMAMRKGDILVVIGTSH